MDPNNRRLTCYILSGSCGGRKQLTSALSGALQKLGHESYKIVPQCCPKKAEREISQLHNVALFLADLTLNPDEHDYLARQLADESQELDLNSLNSVHVAKVLSRHHPDARVAYVVNSESTRLYRALVNQGPVNDIILKRIIHTTQAKKVELFARLLLMHRVVP